MTRTHTTPCTPCTHNKQTQTRSHRRQASSTMLSQDPTHSTLPLELLNGLHLRYLRGPRFTLVTPCPHAYSDMYQVSHIPRWPQGRGSAGWCSRCGGRRESSLKSTHRARRVGTRVNLPGLDKQRA
jgi:hypothetical protein